VEQPPLESYFYVILSWANDNAGALALLLFSSGVLFGVIKWIFRKLEKPSLFLEVIEYPTMCGSYYFGSSFHGTAFLIYIKIQNIGATSVQIDDIHVGYKSEGNKNIGHWRWLKEEIALLEDFAPPIPETDKYHVYPLLKQRNSKTDNIIKTFLEPGEDVNGLVYFEQERSTGDDYPYMEPDNKVQSKIIVHDNKGNSWDVEHRVAKFKIESIREICPSFGLTRQRCS